MPLDLQEAAVDDLTGVLFDTVLVGVESFEDNDKVSRELCYLDVEETLSLDFALLS